jgi:hypothetical protein
MLHGIMIFKHQTALSTQPDALPPLPEGHRRLVLRFLRKVNKRQLALIEPKAVVPSYAMNK